MPSPPDPQRADPAPFTAAERELIRSEFRVTGGAGALRRTPNMPKSLGVAVMLLRTYPWSEGAVGKSPDR